MFVVFHDEEKYKKMSAGSLEIPVEVIHQHIEDFINSCLYYIWTSLIAWTERHISKQLTSVCNCHRYVLYIKGADGIRNVVECDTCCNIVELFVFTYYVCEFSVIKLTVLWPFVWQLVHFMELLPTPLPQMPNDHRTAFCISFWRSLLFILFLFTLIPLFSALSFHSLSLLIRSSSVSAITTRSSAYNNSHLMQLWILYVWLPWQSQITIDSMLNLGAFQLLPQNIYCYHKLFWQLFLHLCT